MRRYQSQVEALKKDIQVLRGALWGADCNGAWQRYEDGDLNLCEVSGCFERILPTGGYRNFCVGHQPKKGTEPKLADGLRYIEVNDQEGRMVAWATKMITHAYGMNEKSQRKMERLAKRLAIDLDVDDLARWGTL